MPEAVYPQHAMAGEVSHTTERQMDGLDVLRDSMDVLLYITCSALQNNMDVIRSQTPDS